MNGDTVRGITIKLQQIINSVTLHRENNVKVIEMEGPIELGMCDHDLGMLRNYACAISLC
jgi:hypothetical protein